MVTDDKRGQNCLTSISRPKHLHMEPSFKKTGHARSNVKLLLTGYSEVNNKEQHEFNHVLDTIATLGSLRHFSTFHAQDNNARKDKNKIVDWSNKMLKKEYYV